MIDSRGARAWLNARHLRKCCLKLTWLQPRPRAPDTEPAVAPGVSLVVNKTGG